MTDLNLDAIENRLDFGHHDAWALLTEVRRLRGLAARQEDLLCFAIDMAYIAGLAAAGQRVNPSDSELAAVRDGLRRILDLVKAGTLSRDTAMDSIHVAMRKLPSI